MLPGEIVVGECGHYVRVDQFGNVPPECDDCWLRGAEEAMQVLRGVVSPNEYFPPHVLAFMRGPLHQVVEGLKKRGIKSIRSSDPRAS